MNWRNKRRRDDDGDWIKEAALWALALSLAIFTCVRADGQMETWKREIKTHPTEFTAP